MLNVGRWRRTSSRRSHFVPTRRRRRGINAGRWQRAAARMFVRGSCVTAKTGAHVLVLPHARTQ
jgi:hypothetical protein